MGKTSTTKASKKKTVSKKKETTKQANAAATATSELKTEEKPAAVESKASRKSSAEAPAIAPAAKKPVLLSDLILQKFDDWQPEKLFAPMADTLTATDAPPFISVTDPLEFDRQHALIFKTFDMKTIIEDGLRYAAEKAAAEKAEAERIAAERAAAEKAAAEKAKAERIAAINAAGGLLYLKFEEWQPEKLFVPISESLIIAEAPPFISVTDPLEFDRQHALIFKTFDMKTIIEDGLRYAAEKAAAEKAEAERIAAEKAAAEKAEAERIAAEKAAAEKAEAERIAAEKAAAEKAEAERIAAEKAAAEKAEAERIAAEKAAAEKAEAERIAAEKAAAEKAAAERAAADLERKEALERQQASSPKVKVSYGKPAAAPAPLPEPPKPLAMDPVDLSIKVFGTCIAALLLIMIGTSIYNAQHFYIKPIKNGIEIRQGSFAPKGDRQVICLDGIQAPAIAKSAYCRSDVYPIIFNYFLNKADALLNKPGIPDFEEIKHVVRQAEPYAITKEHRDAAALRLNGISKALLVYKADISIARGKAADLKTAVEYLNQALAQTSDKTETETLEKKIQAVESRLEKIEAKPTTAPAAKQP